VFKPWPAPSSYARHFIVFLHEGSFFLKYRLHLRLGQDYEQNGVGEKRGRVRLNRLSGRKVGGLYGARKAEIGGTFQKERESAGVERSRISRGFGKQRKDRGASGRVLGCLTVRATRISQSSFSSLVLCYHLLLRCHSSLRWHVFVRCISSCVGSPASRCILANRNTYAWWESAS